MSVIEYDKNVVEYTENAQRNNNNLCHRPVHDIILYKYIIIYYMMIEWYLYREHTHRTQYKRIYAREKPYTYENSET